MPYCSAEHAIRCAFAVPEAHVGQTLGPREGVMRLTTSCPAHERIAQDGIALSILRRALPEFHFSILGCKNTDHIDSPGVYALHCVSVTLILRDNLQHIERDFIRHFAVPRWIGGKARSGSMLEWAERSGVPQRTLSDWNSLCQKMLRHGEASAQAMADTVLKETGLIA
jgi:hypothetical protein